VRTVRPERARSARADPTVASVVAFFLLAEPFLEEAAQLFGVESLE
jgi:hypothetical protein